MLPDFLILFYSINQFTYTACVLLRWVAVSCGSWPDARRWCCEPPRAGLPTWSDAGQVGVANLVLDILEVGAWPRLGRNGGWCGGRTAQLRLNAGLESRVVGEVGRRWTLPGRLWYSKSPLFGLAAISLGNCATWWSAVSFVIHLHCHRIRWKWRIGQPLALGIGTAGPLSGWLLSCLFLLLLV